MINPFSSGPHSPQTFQSPPLLSQDTATTSTLCPSLQKGTCLSRAPLTKLSSSGTYAPGASCAISPLTATQLAALTSSATAQWWPHAQVTGSFVSGTPAPGNA